MRICENLPPKGWKGLLLAGVLFIVPAALFVLGIAWVYRRYGATPQAGALMYGIKPVIIAVVAQALVGMSRTAIKDLLTAVAGAVVLVAFLLGANELALLLAAGTAVMLLKNLGRPASEQSARASVWWMLPPFGVGLPALVQAAVPVSLLQLFLVFLKMGSVLYGSGYVLLAFLHGDLVERLGWLTEQQLLDAVAVGQFTPGPVFTTATFVGYLVASWPGAVLATLGIFLPSFVFVALSNPLIPRLRRSRWFGALLDGVNAASLALMAGVMLQLARASLVDIPTVAIALVAALLLIRFKVNSAWLIVGGACTGLLLVQL